MTINLFVSFWKSDSDIRNLEIIDTYIKNASVDIFDNIYIFIENELDNEYLNNSIHSTIETSVTKSKIHYIVLNERTTYQLIIDFINTISSVNDINVIANSDILFNHSLFRLETKLDHNTFYCITRHELDGSLYWIRNTSITEVYIGSQDVWIWKGICKINNANFYFGIPTADHKLAYLANQSGYSVKNPCLSIIVTHNHKSNIRSGSSSYSTQKKLNPPYLFLKPIFLNDSIEFFVDGGIPNTLLLTKEDND